MALLLFVGGALRAKVVGEFHAPAGDGLEYHKLAHELYTRGRFAYAPAPAPPSYGRMPGYPMLLTLVEDGQPFDIDRVVEKGTRWNIWLDLLTAIFVFLAAREAFGEGAAWTALVLTLASPLLLLDCCYLLRETLTTTLTTATVWLLVVALRRRWAWPLVPAAALTGLTMLVRSDAATIVLAFAPPWWAAVRSRPWGARLGWAALSSVVCLAVFSPWPIRNLRAFGEMHPFSAQWIDRNGVPLPTGERDWMRTWVDDSGEGYLNIRFTRHLPIEERQIDPHAFDDLDEKKRLIRVLSLYNHVGLTSEVDAGLRGLARDRTQRQPFRVLVWLPLRRGALWWWHFPPSDDQPLVSKFLHQPKGRWVFDWMSHAVAILSVLGGIALLLRRENRSLAACFAIILVVRTLAMSWAAPDGGYQRYLAPVYPVALMLAAALPFLVGDYVRRARVRAGR